MCVSFLARSHRVSVSSSITPLPQPSAAMVIARIVTRDPVREGESSSGNTRARPLVLRALYDLEVGLRRNFGVAVNDMLHDCSERVAELEATTARKGNRTVRCASSGSLFSPFCAMVQCARLGCIPIEICCGA